MTISQQTIQGEGRESLFAPLEGGHPVGWYAVARSEELARGRVVGIELCDGRLALYRGEDGTARAMTPYCRHMGSDLTVGDVVGNDLRCAFHHWQYGTDGRCSQIPSGDRIPAAAKLRSFPVEEKWGLVWVFWGPEVVYPVPSFQEWGDEWVCRAFEVPLNEPLHVAPWIFTTNVFDFVHFRVVHGVAGLNPDVEWGEWSGAWTAEFPHPQVGKLVMSATVWGTNAVVNRSVRGEEILAYVASATPMGSAGTRFFMSVAARRGETAEAVLDQQQALHTQIINEDLPIMNTLRLGDDHFVASDRQMVKYLRRVRAFPRVSMAELEAG